MKQIGFCFGDFELFAAESAAVNDIWSGAEVVSVYTRAQAIADGELIDITETAREQGFKYPVAITRAAWSEFAAWTDADSERKGTYQDEAGRLWDVLTMLRFAARRCDGDLMRFQVARVPRDGAGRKARVAELKAICGPDDDGSPCITIMLPEED